MKITDYHYHLKGKDDFIHKNHTHDEVELIQVIQGTGTVLKSNESYPLQEQFLYIINARIPHVLHPENNEVYTRNRIVIDAETFYSFCREIGLETHIDKLLLCPPISTENHPQIDHLFKMVAKLCATGKEEDSAFAHGYILEILHFAFSSMEFNTTYQVPHTVIQEILNIIAAKNGMTSLSEISTLLHMNKYYLCHLFKEKTGITLSDYLGEKKYEKIVGLLTETTYTLEEIASLSGFSSASSLTRFFKTRTGTCPKNYRKLNMIKKF